MSAPEREPLTLPVRGTVHAHTGCFHVECPLPGGLELWLLGGAPGPRFEAGRPQFRLGQTLAGFLRPQGECSEEVQQRLVQSSALAGLEVKWIDLPFSSMRRWFEFRVEPGLVNELFRRLFELGRG